VRRTARPWPIAFTAEGLNIERFLRMAGEQGICLTGIRRSGPRRISAFVQETQMPALQELALRGGWRMTTGSRKGMGRAAEWLRSRWFLAAAILIAGIALLAASRVVWRVEVRDAGSYDADIRAALTEMGVTAPLLRSRVNLGELRDSLEWRYPRIAWFECGWRGTALVIRPVQGVLPRTDTDYDGSCDVIAARDGIVHTIVTKAGTPLVQPGDLVRAGEVLIRGEERTSEGNVKPVAARGSVIARVWEGASVRMPTAETVTTYTGATETVWTVRTPWFDLWPMGESDFAQYDASVSEMPFGGIFIPMVLHIETRMEAECTVRMRDQAALEAEANAAAVRKLHEKLGPEESPIDIWGNCSMIDDGNVLSVAICELHREIGRQAPSSGMAASGQTGSE